MRWQPLLIISVLIASVGCASEPIGTANVSDSSMSGESRALVPIAQGKTHYDRVVVASRVGVFERVGDELPAFDLPYYADLVIEVTWESTGDAAEIDLGVGTMEGTRLGGTRGPSPLILSLEGVHRGAYFLRIAPPTDPGAIVDQTFSWTVSATAREEPAGLNETILGSFERGLVYFSFVPTGPDHEVWANVSGTVNVFIHDGGGVMVLGSPRDDMLSAQGSGVRPVRIEAAPPHGSGGGFRLTTFEELWNTTFWVAVGSANDSGPGHITIGLKGNDIRLASPPVEADARYFGEEGWSGALDARVGRNDLGATGVVERSLAFETHNGTLLVGTFGVGDARADAMTLRNSTDERTWTGLSTRWTRVGLGTDSTFMLAASGPADAWELSFTASARPTGWPDHVFVADAVLPEALRPNF